ncbi:unannotated protein [freshwater metagenome]|uniref:Unannotated protein n=1 Tax=freshwater metagenome TaxID=449393 RepID=A0A6J7RFT5_9ZZZZ
MCSWFKAPVETDDYVPPDHLPCLQEGHLGRMRPTPAAGDGWYPQGRALQVHRRREGRGQGQWILRTHLWWLTTHLHAAGYI